MDVPLAAAAGGNGEPPADGGTAGTPAGAAARPQAWTPADRAFMRRALALAARARGRTHPNPMVGAVIVREGTVVGEGFHRRAGSPHAEVEALRMAGPRARGATLYVTLEPCCHHGRTPPCTDALIAAGLRRVVVAMPDPDPRVAGKGIAVLAAAGIDVAVGLEEAAARRLNEAYIVHRRLGRPMVTAKYAMTLDGRIATARGDSRWVTGARARRWVHRLRDRVDAILVGVGTVLADDPELTVRLHPGGRDPIRIVLDSRARTPPTARVVQVARRSPAPTWVAVTPAAPAPRVRRLEAAGARILTIPAGPDGRVALPHLLRTLAAEGVVHLLVEGGATVHGAFFGAGLVDRVVALVAPKLVGGAAAPGPIGGQGVDRMDEAPVLSGVFVRRLGRDWLIGGYLNDPVALEDRAAPAPGAAPRGPAIDPGTAAPAPRAGAPARPGGPADPVEGGRPG
ncbi:bifunctional diaminohydroxyphosphoribosylaminopyrimidine deaminase/5-amino-6-(5-phosphoribosylamino)uracil reductase RibD [Thermaerobacter sp. FW80]|uniref:bifunctional diaminohydroxyphosphoribosylaminopyrimidine deaminase/5-amino-6-(5-phosphoribosylamino)uracil reductase RibD n=1 Tax=Thermaerobacter sp. FW80 TaxID=2546351 RepID=UPI0010755D51|nr:bifunctional diaminohydroxyphosphoribosylaminopyrimidine deaminase/5-amino-6-(5-phosphoribosylamino)uracil reductase RibD [Thermaerobacter sp. FW80]QBS38154.1 bifunctional diaminohydroxyphosphoribosylaminopyrimidine deaminase/5-amino-6-(5-phosphoribosylamino)uracil reductase RibD [Thermaerobacter sp. FW80]